MEILIPILVWTCIAINLLVGLWLIVLGFQRYWGWGVAMVLPLVVVFINLTSYLQDRTPPQTEVAIMYVVGFVLYICFIVVAWPDTRSPVLWWLTSGLLMLCAIGLLVTSLDPMPAAAASALRFAGLSQDQLGLLELQRTALHDLRGFHPKDKTPPAPTQTTQTGTRGSASPPEAATPAPVFHSRLPPPRTAAGEHEAPQPGIYYLLERVTTKTAKGVQNGLPGERVTVLERLPGNKVRVTVGNADFVVLASQLTDDIAVAREVEKQDFVAHGGQL